MPNIEYLLPNIGRTVPPGDPGPGECRVLGEGGGRVGSAFLRVPDAIPDARPDAQLPCSCPAGPSPPPTTEKGLWQGLLALSGEVQLACVPTSSSAQLPPPQGWVGVLFTLLHWFLS